MPTPLMWSALDRCESSFRFYWSCPYGWNAKAGKLVYNGKLSTLKGWLFALLSTALNLCALAVCLGACNFTKSCSFSLMELMIIAIWTAVEVLTICYDALAYFYFEDAALAFNRLKYIYSVLMKRGKGRWDLKKLDLPGMSYHVMVMTLAAYPYFVTFFGVIIFNVDPLYYAARQLHIIPYFHSHSALHLTFIVTRMLATFLAFTQTCRVSSVLLIGAKIMLGMSTDDIRDLGARAREIAWKWSSLRHHAQLEIIFKFLQSFLNPAILVAMSMGLALDILANYVTLKLYGTIPMPFYLFFPSLSILIPAIVQLLVPAAGDIAETDKRLHQEWAFYAKNCRDKKYLRRKLRCVRTLRLYAGVPGTNIFPLVASTKGTFYRAMIDYTISALLSL